jgi:hypothetical protein
MADSMELLLRALQNRGIKYPGKAAALRLPPHRQRHATIDPTLLGKGKSSRVKRSPDPEAVVPEDAAVRLALEAVCRAEQCRVAVPGAAT